MSVVVALVGTSKSEKNGVKMVDENELSDRICDALDLIENEFPDSPNIEVWSGSGAVPIAMYEELATRLYGPTYVLCGCSKVKNGYFKSKPVKTEIIGTRYGDESQHLVDKAQIMIKIGGGPQAEQEYKMFAEQKPDCPRYELYLSYKPRHGDQYLENGATPNAQHTKGSSGKSVYSSKHVRQQASRAGS